MTCTKVLAVLGVALATLAPRFAPSPVLQQAPSSPPRQAPSPEDVQKAMQQMMEASKKWTTPGAAHEKLKALVGKWDVTSKMAGAPAGKSHAEFTSILGGRFVRQDFSGELMHLPYDGLGLIGYDNFKQAYVQTWVDSLNTYKLESQGKFDQTGKTLIFYGTMDEYLTGENDKEVKYVYRFVDADHFTMEIHDLAIGETNTLVVEINYSRAK